MSGKSRSFLGVLYPDSESYDCSAVLERLSCLFDEWAYIVHDSDSDENGELKKAHIHWIGRLENATSLLAVADRKHLSRIFWVPLAAEPTRKRARSPRPF